MSSVYRVNDAVGASSHSWRDAARTAANAATESIRDLRIAEVASLDVTIDDEGEIQLFRARVQLSFRYESDD